MDVFANVSDHFASLIRCTVERYDTSAKSWTGTGGRMLDGFMESAFGAEVATKCIGSHLLHLPPQTKLVIMFGLGTRLGYLARNYRDEPSSWRVRRGHNLNSRGLHLIGKYLRAHTHYRSRAPKLDHLRKLKAADRELVECHLLGNDARQHPLVLSKGDPVAQGKFFSAVRLRVLDELNIDMAIPWKSQTEDIWQDISDHCFGEVHYRIPEPLRAHSFCSDTAKAAIQKLKAMIKALAAKKS